MTQTGIYLQSARAIQHSSSRAILNSLPLKKVMALIAFISAIAYGILASKGYIFFDISTQKSDITFDGSCLSIQRRGTGGAAAKKLWTRFKGKESFWMLIILQLKSMEKILPIHFRKVR